MEVPGANRKEAQLPRPFIGSVFLAGLVQWGTCALSMYALRCANGTVCEVLAGVFGIGLAISVACLIRFKRKLASALLAGVCAGMLCAACQALALFSQIDAVDSLRGTDIVAVATEDSSESAYGASVVCRVSKGPLTGALVSVNFDDDTDSIHFGDVLTMGCRVNASDYSTNEYAWRNGIVCTLSAYRISVDEQKGIVGALLSVRNTALDAFSVNISIEGAVLQALVCGYRSAINDSSIYEDFKRCGLAHLIAVSGAHLAIVCGIAMALAARLHARRGVIIGVGVSFAVAYLIVSAAPISALRAVIMTSLSLSSFFAKRRSTSINSIGLCLIVMIPADPLCSLSVSLLFSAGSTACIVLFSPLLTRLIMTHVPKTPRFIAESVALTSAANIVTAPCAAALFSQVSLVSVLANVLVGPLFPIVCGAGLLAALVVNISASVGAVFVTFANTACGLLCSLVSLLSEIPYAAIPCSIDMGLALAVSILSFAFLWVVWPTRLRAVPCVVALVVVCGFCFVVFAWDGETTQIIMLDVGQGDAIVLKSRGATMLIDTGNHDSLLLKALAEQGIYRLDAVLITHCDDDHCGSIDALRQTIPVDTVLIAADLLDSTSSGVKSFVAEISTLSDSIIGLDQGDEFAVGDFRVHILWPQSVVDDGGNNDSVIAYVIADVNEDGLVDETALLTGDAEAEAIEDALDYGGIDHVNILKASHHGSRTGLTSDLAVRLSPNIALISCGEDNSYGHPHAEVLEYLQAVQTEVYRTDEMGDVSCTLKESGVSVACVG